MQPPKYGTLVADQAIQFAIDRQIETDIDAWIESKPYESVQDELFEEEI
jgi:hypothetical protein